MKAVLSPEDAFKIEHLVNPKVVEPERPVAHPVREIGRKALLNPKQLQEFVRRVSEFRERTETEMTWRESAKLIQEILGGQSKVSRTSATRYLQQAISLAASEKEKDQRSNESH